MKQKIFVTIFAAFAFSLTALAQHETIVVTNTYEPTVPEVKKAEVPMAVPDSLLRFDLDYKYSIFDNPYQGSYEFKPYLIGIEPESAAARKYLYVKAGAGYSLRPTLDLIWAPRSRYDIMVTARHDSYFGEYKTLGLNGENVVKTIGDSYKGRDMVNGAGISGSYHGDDWSFRMAAGYDGISAKDLLLSRDLHSGYLRAGIGSTDPETDFVWDADLQYRYTRDEMRWNPGTTAIRETDVRFDGCFGPVFGNGHKVLVDIGMEIAEYGGGTFKSHAGLLSLTPTYRFETGYWHISLGAELSTIIRQDRSNLGRADAMHVGRWRLPIPVADISYNLLDGALVPYVLLKGGSTVNTWSSMVSRNHFRNPLQARFDQAPMENAYDKINAALGFRGRLLQRFVFDVSAGYAATHNGLVDIWQPIAGQPDALYGYSDYRTWFADLKYDLHAGAFQTMGTLSFRNGRFDHDEAVARGFTFIAPAHFSGQAEAFYTFRGRIRGGVHCAFETRRRGVGARDDLRVPGWVDLGLDARYVMNRRLTFWVTSGNLLGQTIQRVPFHAESGAYVQGGLIFQL